MTLDQPHDPFLLPLALMPGLFRLDGLSFLVRLTFQLLNNSALGIGSLRSGLPGCLIFRQLVQWVVERIRGFDFAASNFNLLFVTNHSDNFACFRIAFYPSLAHGCLLCRRFGTAPDVERILGQLLDAAIFGRLFFATASRSIEFVNESQAAVVLCQGQFAIPIAAKLKSVADFLIDWKIRYF